MLEKSVFLQVSCWVGYETLQVRSYKEYTWCPSTVLRSIRQLRSDARNLTSWLSFIPQPTFKNNSSVQEQLKP